MEDLVQIAQRVVKKTSEILSFPISVSDDKGYIIGCTNRSRIGMHHQPSIEVIKKNAAIVFEPEMVRHMENVLPGIAVPLVFDEKTIGVLGIIGQPNEVKPYAKLVKRYVEMTWQESFRSEIEDLKAKTHENFLQFLLFEQHIDWKRLQHYCNILGIDCSINRICIVIDLQVNMLFGNRLLTRDIRQKLLDCVGEVFLIDAVQDICSYFKAEQIIVVKAIDNNNMYSDFIDKYESRAKDLLRLFSSYQIEDAAIAVGDLKPTIMDIGDSYRQALRLFEVGEKAAMSPKVYSYRNWELLTSLVPHCIDKEIHEKLMECLKPLFLHEDFEVLVRDFIHYCQNNLNISKAARELFIHRNTLIYRLKKIESITSLNLDTFEHCMVLFLTLRSLTCNIPSQLNENLNYS
ncbi:CdaR family transcriptional regulator [Terrihalobacillus insolitus]|uniref:CdaR family transcriptional regulator n=1 Tax=Terrihalobacillus insolitus TaxID=2950438 RepID=UPI00233F7DCF|nr:sugar diacid recognition domain-containing protein [Terrihalobacillus insolitus]MDC3412066.1 helix-turn-helix domain-containing protein [Terrihalobacillus insolitus]